MQLCQSRNRVIENANIAGNIYLLKVEGCYDTVPGQFFNVRAWDKAPILSRPLSIFDCTEGSISFLYEVKGRGTKILEKLKPGDEVELIGPLGNGFDIGNITGRIAVVTGGIGIAPLLYTVKSIRSASCDLYAGFRDRSYATEKFEEHVSRIFIATDSGAEGHRGVITEIFDPRGYELVLCCGPEKMIRRVIEMCLESNVKIYVSMESHMACGIGACLVCTCKTKQGMKRTCKDGPVFKGEDVI